MATAELRSGSSGLNQLTGDVTAGPGTGSQVATVAFVGGSAASAVNTATILVNTSHSGNVFLASPAGGGAGAPAFRAIVTGDLPAGTGTVTSVSVVSANGLAGTVATATTTPAITLSTSITGILQGNGTAISAATTGNLTDAGTDGITVTGGTGAVLGSGASLSQHVADTTHNGYLSSTDWNTFNNKQSTLTLGNLTDAGTDGITVTGGTGAVVGSGTSLSQHVADTTHNGYLSSTDWNTFNGKQAAGNYITALTGDVTAAGPGSVAATLATVNGNIGSFGSSTAIPSFTVNAKGLITAASTNVVIAPAGTLTGTTLAANVVSSSLTSVGTITSGVWNGTTIAIANGGTGQTTKAAAFDALSPMTTQYDLIIGGASGTGTRLAKGADGTHLTTKAGVVAWTTDPTPYSVSTISSNTSSVSGTTYLCDTSGGAFNVTLPTPASGAFIAIKDKTGSFQTNNLTILQNAAEKIEGLAASKVLQTNWGAFSFFSDGTDWYMGPF